MQQNNAYRAKPAAYDFVQITYINFDIIRVLRKLSFTAIVFGYQVPVNLNL